MTNPSRITAAARETGANDALIRFTRVYVAKIQTLLETRGGVAAAGDDQDLETIQRFLESLQQGFAKKRIVFSSGDDTIELQPKNLLKFSVRARKKEDKTKLSIKISWKEGKIKVEKTPLEIGD